MRAFQRVVGIAIACGLSCSRTPAPGVTVSDLAMSNGMKAASDLAMSNGMTADDAMAAAIDYCALCTAQRCADSAQACIADATCKTEAFCWNKNNCVNSCSACSHGDSGMDAKAITLARCVANPCLVACYWLMSASDSGQCVQLGSTCDPLVPGYACCTGTCQTPPGPNAKCCNAPGESCDTSVVNPNAECCGPPGKPELGHCNAGKCEYQTCSQTNTTCDSSLPCCDSRLQCTGTGGVGECCAPDHTVVSAQESNLCCSHGVIGNPDGTQVCGHF